MATVNDEIHSGLTRHLLYLQQVAGTVRNTMNRRLDKTTPALRRLLLQHASLAELSPYSVRYERALRRLERDIYEVRKVGYKTAHVYAAKEFRQLTYEEPQFVDNLIVGAVPIDLKMKEVPRDLTNKIYAKTPIQGATTAKWLRDWKQGDMNRISQAVRVGLSAGLGMDQITQNIIGTKAQGYTDGTLNATRNATERLSRTVTSGLTNTSRGAYYGANEKAIESFLYSAVLDARTSPFCRRHSGNVYDDLTKAPKLPAHPNCRSQYIPVLGVGVLGKRRTVAGTNFRTEAENAYIAKRVGMGDDLNEAKRRWKRLGKVTKSHMINEQVEGYATDVIGKTPYEKPYEDWFKDQDATFQNSVLGNKVAKVYRKKGLTFAEMMQANGNQVMTVDQLKKKYGK